MVKVTLSAMAVLAVAACASAPAPASAQIGSGQPSLQSPPFTEPKLSTPNAPPRAAPLKEPGAAGRSEDTVAFEAVASQFDPAKQRFVWVLPPGIHGKGPWDMRAVVALDDKPHFETTLPLVAEKSIGGSRPEFPAGYEIVRLTDHGEWAANTAKIDDVIQKLVAEHGRGHGSLEMSNDLNVEIDASHQKAYCTDRQIPDVRLYMEEVGNPDLIRLDVDAMRGIIQVAVMKACKN